MPHPPTTPTILSYTDWNESIGRYCFNRRNADLPIRFAVDPLVLLRAAAEGSRHYHFSSPDAAAADFRMAVSQQIDANGWRIGHTSYGRIPSGLAKLALQVLAVFEMAADDEIGGGYWAALHATLGRSVIHRGRMPDDLKADTHQANWAALANWANEVNSCQFGILPSPDEIDGGYRHVRLPMFHGLLRHEDIRGLFRFFRQVGIQAGEEISPEELLPDLRVYSDDIRVFRGPHARRVLRDERLLLAANQIAIAAVQWDGHSVDLARSRHPEIRLWLAAQKASGSGANYFGGLLRNQPNGTSTVIPGVELSNLFSQSTLRHLSTPDVYHPVDERLLLVVRSLLDDRYVETRRFCPGDAIIVGQPHIFDGERIERELVGIAVGERVAKLAGETSGVPRGWIFYRLRVRENLAPSDVPSFLRKRVRLAGFRLRVFGGLKIRGVWMEGAGPIIAVEGRQSQSIVVDGTEYDLSDGRLYPERCPALSTQGRHEAWLPGRLGHLVRFRVIQPRTARFHKPIVEAGWARIDTSQWPSHLVRFATPPSSCIHGPVVEGDWPSPTSMVTFAPPARAAVRLALALKNHRAAGTPVDLAALKKCNEQHPNLIVRQLARAIKPWSNQR